MSRTLGAAGDKFREVIDGILRRLSMLEHQPNILVPPRMTTAEKTALSPDVGWTVFDTTLQKLCVYTSTGWKTVTSA